MTPIKRRHAFLIAILVGSLATLLLASVREVQIYGIVERVVFEPNDRIPERIKVYGAFALLYTNQEPVLVFSGSGDVPYTPHRGFLYFKLPPTAPNDTKNISRATARTEWADLKTVAGTGQAIMFGSWTSTYLGLVHNSRTETGFVSGPPYDDALRVLDEGEKSPRPIPYTMDTGIQKIPNQGKYGVLITQLKQALQR